MKQPCAGCGKVRDILPAGNPAYALLCVPCRKRKSSNTSHQQSNSQHDNHQPTQCTIVIGPPASGKTTWIHNRAQPTDLVIDFDAITRALSGPGTPGWTVPSQLIGRAAFEARAAAIRVALRSGTPGRSWVIHSCPTLNAVTDYQRRGARVQVVDPGREVVMSRIAKERPQEKARIAAVWYDELLPSYPPGLVR